jgi:hypothetical protein
MKVLTIEDLMKLPRDPDEEFRKGTGNCEFCGEPLGKDKSKIFLSMQYYGDEADESILFTCDKCEPQRTYDIPLGEFQANPIDWMAHLTEKNWLTPTLALKFFKAMYKLRYKLKIE